MADVTRVDDSARTGIRGITLTKDAVEKHLGWVFREQPIPDAGIDGHLEVLDGSVATGKLLAVQVKAGDSYFSRRAGTNGWWFTDSVDHFKYWLDHTCPVVVVMCDVEREICYWQLVTEETVVRSVSQSWKMLVPRANVLDSRAADVLGEAARRPSSVRQAQRVPGTRIPELDALTLEVRLWSVLPGATTRSAPAYIPRPHDTELDELVRAALGDPPQSGIKILVGESTSGKTRALYEALQRAVKASEPASLADGGWRVWPRMEMEPSEFLRDISAVAPRTVIWLNEAQRYLLEPAAEVREAIATELRSLLTDPDRSPVLVLGTLWPDYWDALTLRRRDGHTGLAAAARLLNGNLVHVPSAFTADELDAARSSGDARLVEAADRAQDGEVTQYLAGVPLLLQRYKVADSMQRAIVHAAMDARRMGHSEWLSPSVLEALAEAYLTGNARRVVDSHAGWFEHSVARLATSGDSGALLHSGSLGYRLEDYLDQLGRDERRFDFPHQPFWDAVIAADVTPQNMVALADNARWRLRFGIAESLYRAAGTRAAGERFWDMALVHEERRHHAEAEHLARLAAEQGFPEALTELATYRKHRSILKDQVKALLREAIAAGDLHAVTLLADLLEGEGDHVAAEKLARDAAERGTWQATALVAESRLFDAPDQAMAMVRTLPPDMLVKASIYITLACEQADYPEGAEELAAMMAAEGYWTVYLALADYRLECGDKDGAQHLYTRFVEGTEVGPVPGNRYEVGNPYARPRDNAEKLPNAQDDDWSDVDFERAEQAVAATKWLLGRGQLELAEEAALEAACNGDAAGLVELGRVLLIRGDRDRADDMALRAVNMSNDDFASTEHAQELLAEIRGDGTVLIAGLDAAGRTRPLDDRSTDGR